MPFTKKEKEKLTSILYDLMKAENYLKKSTGIAMKTDHPNGGSYTINNPAIENMPKYINVVNSQIGSDVCYLYNAKEKLFNLLQEDNNKHKEEY